MTKIFDRKYSLPILGALVCFYIASLFYRVLQIDGGWLAEQSYWLAKLGYVKSVLETGVLDYETQRLSYHKLYIVVGALVTKAFGLNMYIFKAISLVFFGGFIYMFKKHLDKKQIPFELQIIGVILIFVSHFMFHYSFAIRPEVMMVFLGFLSYGFLDSSLESDDNKLPMLAGLFAGLAASTHLNGSILIVSGGVVLALNRSWKKMILFGIFGGIGSLGYFWDIRSMQDIQTMLYQLFTDPAMDQNESGWLAPLIKLSQEHMRFFGHGHEASISLLLFFCIFTQFKYLKEKHKHLLIYTLCNVICLSILTRGPHAHYIFIHYPFFYLIIIHALNNMKGEFLPQKKKAGVLMILILLFNFSFNWDQFKEAGDVASENAEIAKQIPGAKKVMSSISFVFDQLPNYELFSERTIVQQNAVRTDFVLTFEAWINSAKTVDADHILVDRRYLARRVHEALVGVDLSVGQLHYGYELIFNEGNYLIWKREGFEAN